MIDWDEYSRQPCPFAQPGCVSYQELSDYLTGLDRRPDGLLSVDVIGESAEGRPLRLARIGKGSVNVALWSQMHGDEPTHTVVLVDLLRWLLAASACSRARTILDRCSLTLFPMVNPDGAERSSRYNAQGIDINRDALRNITPEAQALRRMITAGSHRFAFNLHNQHANTTVDGTKPAVASLLVPPVDPEDTQSPAVKTAKRVAGNFLRAIQPHAGTAISRYDADHMPRCFGEWTQARQISTVLIEAGDCPHEDQRWLPWLHLHGLAITLQAIAQDNLVDEDIRCYESLRRSSPHRVFDLMIQGTRLAGDEPAAGKPVDLGINFTPQSDGGSAGTITEIGDLSITTGRQMVTGHQRVAVPGRIVYDESLQPDDSDLTARMLQLTQAGVTSVVGCLQMDDEDALQRMEQLRRSRGWPINLGFVGRSHDDQVPVRRLAVLLQAGVLGLIGDGELDMMLLPRSEILRYSRPPAAVPEWLDCSNRLADQFGLADRGKLQRNSAADVVTLATSSGTPCLAPFDVQDVIVNGVLTIHNGEPMNLTAGRLLHRRYGSDGD